MSNGVLGSLSTGMRIGIIAGVAAAMTLVVVFFVDPFPQNPGYHCLADDREFLGIPHFGDVVSNLAFLLVGIAGLMFVLGPKGQALLNAPGERLPYVAFFAALVLVTFGSTYYHWAPSNGPLFWDRLPITIGFMALLAAFVADRIDLKWGVRALPVLMILGVAVTYQWLLSEGTGPLACNDKGRGDLRFYALVQAAAVVSILLMCWLFPARNTDIRYVWMMLVFYGIGKALEFSSVDVWVYDLLGWVSGHTLKHLVSAVATYMVLAMLMEKSREDRA